MDLSYMANPIDRRRLLGDEIVGRNTIRLLKEKNLSKAQVGRDSSVSRRTVGNVVMLGEAGSSQVTTIDGLAEFFDVPIWQMFLEKMPGDPETRKDLENAVQMLLSLSENGRRKVLERIEEVAIVEKAKLSHLD